jgi:hypothetical protein
VFFNFTLVLILIYLIVKFEKVMDIEGIILSTEDINTEATLSAEVKEKWLDFFTHPVEI